MRNWSYAYALDQEGPKVKDKLAVSPLPPFEGGGKGGVLGGNGPVVIARSPTNPKGSVSWLDFWTSERRSSATRRSTRCRRRCRSSTTTRP